MKRLMFAMAMTLCVALAATAQKAELVVGYGAYTQMDASDCSDGWPTKAAWGALTAGLNLKVAPDLSIGPSYTFSSQSVKHDGGNVYYHVIMLNAKYNYYRTSIFTLYAHVGIGGMVSHISPNNSDAFDKGHFAFVAVPLGAEVSISPSAYMFGELGYGAQGLLQLGFRFKL